jgi:MFS family permease
MEELTRGKRVGFRGLLGANSYLLISTATAIIGSFLYGTDQGVLSNLLTGENFGATFPNIYTDPVLKGWVVSVLQLGAWLGALINGPLANKISRKYSMTVAAFVRHEKEASSDNLTNYYPSCSHSEVLSVVVRTILPTCSLGVSSLELRWARFLMSSLYTLPRSLLHNFEELWSLANSSEYVSQIQSEPFWERSC